MLALEHDILLELGVLYLVVLNQYIFPNHLDGVQLLVFGVLSQKNFSKSAFTQHDNDFEISELRCSFVR